MCGIGGFYTPERQNAAMLSRMTDIISHRGPDDSGAVYFDASGNHLGDCRPEDAVNLALGHRRLSIVDLSAQGHQPMSYKEERYWITYNGEIYNYIELREELRALGYTFRSETDTEVILAAYDAWGTECQYRFNGMWAFALYDAAARSLFLSRDRFGVKPLYYYTAPDRTFYFGSEIKQFTQAPGWQAVLNHQRAYDFLVWGITDHTDETLFDGIYQLAPGCCAVLDLAAMQAAPGKRIGTRKWYILKEEERESGDFKTAAARFKDMFTVAVRLRLRADVPVGSCLSGGLDSSSIVCTISELLKEQGASSLQKTFSACSRVEKFDERKWIDKVVAQTQADAHYTYPELDELFALSEKITWHQDEPFGSTSIFAQWNVFALAAQENVKVMLDGQGADEQLAGYHPFLGARLADLFRQGRLLQLCREMKATHVLHGYSWGWLLSRLAACIMPEGVKPFLRKITGRNQPVPAWLNLTKLKASSGKAFDKAYSSVRGLSYAQLTASNLQMLLHWEDRDSMAHSIEARVPFLDYRLVEYVMSLPDDYKIESGWTKRVLRKAMSGVIPDDIRDRVDKIGFATPEESWIREQAPGLFRQKIADAIENSYGLITPAALTYFDDIVAGKKPFNFSLWRIINFVQWINVFQVKV